jgi:multimeric flavodoxin WrbA
MTEHGWPSDEWPDLYPDILAGDILVLAGPIWLGDNSSVTTRVIERLYALSHLTNDAVQYLFYGKVAGCLITATSTASSSARRTSSTPCSTSGTRSRPRRTPAGSARRGL